MRHCLTRMHTFLIKKFAFILKQLLTFQTAAPWPLHWCGCRRTLDTLLGVPFWAAWFGRRWPMLLSNRARDVGAVLILLNQLGRLDPAASNHLLSLDNDK